jgi:hypothetical protein
MILHYAKVCFLSALPACFCFTWSGMVALIKDDQGNAFHLHNIFVWLQVLQVHMFLQLSHLARLEIAG